MSTQISQSGDLSTRHCANAESGIRTWAGIPINSQVLPPPDGFTTADPGPLRLHLEYWQLHLLRDFDQLLCLEGLDGVEHMPHQIETVRKVLRRFRGRVLLADEVGLGKTIEACLLLRVNTGRKVQRETGEKNG